MLDFPSVWTWMEWKWSFWYHMETMHQNCQCHLLGLTSSVHSWNLRVGPMDQRTLTLSHMRSHCLIPDIGVQQNVFSGLLKFNKRFSLYVLNKFNPSVLWRCWLGGRKGIRPVKNWLVGCWHGYLSGARCRLAYVPADATATHCLLLQ